MLISFVSPQSIQRTNLAGDGISTFAIPSQSDVDVLQHHVRAQSEKVLDVPQVERRQNESPTHKNSENPELEGGTEEVKDKNSTSSSD